MSDQVALWLDVWARGENFARIRAAWLEHAGGLGGPVRVSGQNSSLDGIFQGIDAQGRMLLERPDGSVETIEAGDVNLGIPEPR